VNPLCEVWIIVRGVVVSRAVVGKWGKTLAVRFPGEIIQAVGLCDGEPVEIEAHDGEILIRRPAPHFRLEELIGGKSSEEWRALYAGVFHWGQDVGREPSKNDGSGLFA
jgi:antitoxin MazE